MTRFDNHVKDKTKFVNNLEDIIKSIIDDKIRQKRFPLHAMLNEIMKRYGGDDLREELDALEALGCIKSGNTINSTFYVINE